MKMFKTGLCVVAAGCLLVQGVVAEPRLVVSGVVTDLETGKPIEGARVADDNYGPEPRKGAITDSEGKYSYTTWDEEHNVVARAVGYKPKQKLLTTNPLRTNKGDALNFELSPQIPYATPVSVLLEQGIYTEETVGDLDRAIEIYKQIVDDDQANRKVVAEALFRMGRCRAASGQNQAALKELAKLTTQFPEQRKLLKRASELTEQILPALWAPFSVRTDVAPASFKGVWIGQTTDKPEEGSSTDTITLHILEPSETDWKGSVSGSFARNGKQGITNIRFVDQRITFRTKSRDGGAIVWLGLHPTQDDTLVGESFALGSGDGRNISLGKTPKPLFDEGRDKIIVEDLALRLLVAIREKEDEVLRELSADRIKGWRSALPIFAVEGRERFRQMTGTLFDMRAKECLIQGDFAAVKCVGPESLKGIYLVLFFENTDAGWRNITLKNSPPSKSLESHLSDILGTAVKQGWKTQSTRESDKYVAQIPALKKKTDSPEKLEALERIENIMVNATFHQGSLVELAKLVVEAPHNHQRIVKAAELASQFGYHTGALAIIAGFAAEADHECEELDEILELAVLKLSGTMQVIELAKSAVLAEGNDEEAAVQSQIESMRRTTDYQTLEEALEGEKTMLKKLRSLKNETEPLNLQPAPWKDGEVLRYRLLAKTGMEMGSQIWIANAIEQDGKTCWKIEQRLAVPVNNATMFTRVVAEKESFAPLSGHTKHQLGSVNAQYLPGKVLLGSEGQAAPREVQVPGPIFDNEQVIFLMRRLPLAKGYKAEFPIMSILSGASSLECRIRVMGREQVDIASEAHDCWKIRIQVYAGAMKAVEQTTWFTVDGHVPVKFVTDQMDMELAEHTGTAQKAMELKEHDAVLNLPEGWFGYELPAMGNSSEIVRLMPPEMKLEGMLLKTMRQPLTMSVQEIATTDIEVLKGYFKNYVVRDDTVVEKEINGIPTYIYAADYESQCKAKVEYRAYYVASSRVFWFVFRLDADRFEQEKAVLDRLIEELKVQK